FASGAVRPRDVALREPKWPARTTQFANAYANQFELPVLFYVLTILEYITHLAGIVFVALAWVFVIFRILHAYIHVTSNIVRLRGTLFAVSAAVLAIMWAIYIVQVLILPRAV
ncbi:MAG TPA: MAPEG family protein, partial [Xanthobacteraceae bacterium]|nr:MAPEG family protein [Xanthobacteraceae bacterium]